MTDRPAPWASPAPASPPRRGGRHGVTIRDIGVGVVSGCLVLAAQTVVDGRRDAEADRRENLRFVREMVANGNVDQVSFSSFDLSGRNLSRLDLGKADLVSADMSGAELYETNFEDADLSGATLSNTKIFRVSMAGTVAREANLSDVDLSLADISGANFFGSDLSGARLGDRYRSAATRSGPEGEISFADADLSGARIEMDLSNALFLDTKLYGADLTGSKLPSRIANGDRKPSGQGALLSLCFDDKTVWPEDFPQEHLPELQCEEMKE